MDDRSIYRITRSDLTGSKKRGRSVLAVRMLVARLAWLEAPLRWHDGRVVWDTGEQLVAPGPKELSRAQRTLNRLAEYPHSARAALGDPDAWRAACQARLELAKRLSALRSAEPEARLPPDRARAADSLAPLLQAEALCRGGLTFSPAAYLLQAGLAAEPPVRALLADAQAPPAAHTLAALVLGALHRAHSQRPPQPLSRDTPSAQRRAYAWGAGRGLPPDSGLAAALLAHEAGPELLTRFLQAQETRSILAFPVPFARELLFQGELPERVVRLTEVAADTERLSDRLLHRPAVEEEESYFLNATDAESRRTAAQGIADLFHQHACETRDPQVLTEMARWLDQMLAIVPLFPALTDVIRTAASSVRALPPAHRAAFFRLLSDRHARLWPPSHFIVSFHRRHPEREFGRLNANLQARWHAEARPVLELARRSGDVEVARTALDLDIHGTLYHQEWTSPELLALAVELARSLNLVGPSYVWGAIYRLFHALPDARSVRRIVRALAQVDLTAAPDDRPAFLHDLLDLDAEPRKDLEQPLLQRIAFAPRYLEWARSDTEHLCPRESVFTLALELYAASPSLAGARLDWLLAFLAERGRRQERTWKELQTLDWGGRLALTIAGKDEPLFRTLLRAILEHGQQIRWYSAESAFPLLAGYPGLPPVLGRLLPLQIGRCAELLINLGLTARYGRAALSALEEAFGPSAELPDLNPLPAAWSEALALAPELTPSVALWIRTATLLRESPAPPPGLVRALSLPARLSKEREYLEQRLHREPDRADLRARVDTLRARLAQPDRLAEQIRAEATERLEIAVAEARLRLAERLLDSCHRARLTELAGPLPADLELTDDLRNAALLSVDIYANRKHLRRLLRCHFAGETGWREAHPANAAFLAGLSAQGVDPARWLGEHPRVFRWSQAPGGQVRLWLEQDPIRVLQMGNYFDTCLSVGNGNAFSTIANAVELNKRVIYAADGKGRVLGRKLIALNTENRLLGFRTYTSCADTRQNEHLARLFRRYAEEFAQRCSLELDERGEVPRLFVSEWYNDGIMAWDDESVDGPGNKQSR